MFTLVKKATRGCDRVGYLLVLDPVIYNSDHYISVVHCIYENDTQKKLTTNK